MNLCTTIDLKNVSYSFLWDTHKANVALVEPLGQELITFLETVMAEFGEFNEDYNGDTYYPQGGGPRAGRSFSGLEAKFGEFNGGYSEFTYSPQDGGHRAGRSFSSV